MSQKVIFRHIIDSPCGKLILSSDKTRLYTCDWANNPHRQLIDRKLATILNAVFVEESVDTIQKTEYQLSEYFIGRRKTFDLPIEFIGTEFQKSVWTELCSLKYGETSTYSDIACSLGLNNAVRAVANAIALNPLSIIVPCHRVIGRNNLLTGYAGGIEAKKKLLKIESSNSQ